MGAPARQPRARGRGGDLVPAPRTATVTCLASAGGALALGAALGAGAAIAAAGSAPVAAGAALALLLLAAALLLGRTGPIPFALLLLGTVHAFPETGTALSTSMYGGGLLLAAELAYWSLDERAAQRAEAGVALRRTLTVLGISIAATPASALVLLASQAGLGRSPALTAAGGAALVASLALLAVLARSARDRADRPWPNPSGRLDMP